MFGHLPQSVSWILACKQLAEMGETGQAGVSPADLGGVLQIASREQMVERDRRYVVGNQARSLPASERHVQLLSGEDFPVCPRLE